MGNVVPSCTSPGYAREARGAAAAMFRGDDNDDTHDHADGYVYANNDGRRTAACAISYETRTEHDFFAKGQPSERESIGSLSETTSLQLILDPGQMMSALLEQAEELLRQETTHQNLLDNLENLLRDDDDDDDSDSSSSYASSTSSSNASSKTPRSASSSRYGADELRYQDDRDNDDNVSRGEEDIFSNLSDTDLDSRLDGGRSMATHTVFTTGTAATQPAKNVGRAKKTQSRGGKLEEHNSKARASLMSTKTDLVRRPPDPKLPSAAGTFAATQLLQSQIHSALGSHARRALSKPYLRSAERFQESVRSERDGGERSHRGSKSALPPFPGQCGALGNWKWLGANLHCRDPRSQRQSRLVEPRPDGGQSERVLRYMRALYLQLPSRSASYMKRNPRLKRLLPDNPVSLAHPDPYKVGSLRDHGYGDRDIRKLAESLGASSADGVLAALTSSSSSAAPPPAMQLLTMSSSQHSGNTSSGTGLYGTVEGRDDDDEGELDVADFGTTADGPASTPVRMWVTNQVFLDLAVTGSLGWVRQQPPKGSAAKCNPLSSTSSWNPSPNPYLALINRRSLVPLVVCTSGATDSALRGPRGSLSVLVYATKRRHPDQRPALSTRKLNGVGDKSSLPGASSIDAANPGDGGASYDLPLYSWAKIAVEGSYPHRVTYAVHMAVSDADNASTWSDDTASTGYEPVAQYVAVHDSFRTPEVVVKTRTTPRSCGSRRDYAGCAIVSLCHARRRRTGAANGGTRDLFAASRHDDADDNGDDDEEGGGSNDVCTRVSVSTEGWGGAGRGEEKGRRGAGGGAVVDPALLLCLGAVVDEFIEKSLRIESRGLAEAVYKRSQRAL